MESDSTAELDPLLRIGMFAVFASCVVFAVVRLATTLSTGLATPWWGNALAALAMGILLALHRYDPRRWFEIDLHGTLVVATTVLFLPLFYGMPSTLWWLALVPFSVVLLRGSLGAIVWTFFVAALIGVGSLMGPAWQVADAAGETTAERFLARLFFMVVLVFIALGFRSTVNRQTNDLRTAAEELQRANAAKNRFLANMSHELRTPLHGVMAMTELALDDEGLPETAERHLQTAAASGRLLFRLLDDLLDVSRSNHVELVLVERPLSLARVVRDTLGPLEPIARHQGLAWSVALDGDVPDRRMGDATRLTQILVNLVGNALKFTEEGSIDVQIRRNGAPTALALIVRDTGPGIPEADRERVFEPFTQLEGHEAAEYAGAGLGLAIVADLVAAMGGTIRIEPVPVGTCFVVELDLPVLSDELEVAAVERVEAEQAALRVLVVEDDPTNQLVARAFLQRLGHEVTLAGDGVEAMQCLEQTAFDVVLTDLRMPRMDGVELITALEKRPSSPPIVLCTAQAGPEEARLVERTGVSALLEKPFTLDGIRQVLAPLTARSRELDDVLDLQRPDPGPTRG